MKQILPPDDAALKLCGMPKRKESTLYRMTRHCISVPCADGTLLYQTMTCGLYLLENGETVEEHADELIAAWLMVPNEYDEQKTVRDMREVGTYFLPKKERKGGFTILTTTDCNARCFYCYEMGCKRQHMTPQVAHDVAAYIAERCGEKPVSLHWFGGEPLYNREAIEIVIGDLKQCGIEYTSSMISNGYYLDAETAKIAKDEWKLKRVQITLDGTREIYNRTKAYIEHDTNAFDRVLDNISFALNEGIQINIRLNMDEKNADDLLRLADILGERFSGREEFSAYAALLQHFRGKINDFESIQKAAEQCIALHEKLETLGICSKRTLQREFIFQRCMADNDASELIMPDGTLGKCEHFNVEDSYGSIYTNERNEAILRAWKEWEYYPECDGCALYPQCFNLKKCEWLQDGCQRASRLVTLHNLERQILTAYQDYLDAKLKQ